ncbi:MAG: LysR family transcriptional regulator [Hyphomicrobiales bacterium]|nr:LysR family transcriptional regulator [Hyphomicrobiales bacterium]
MELSDLRIFSAVVREGGVTRAAERLHRVQSNVTTRIRQLEDHLGVKLFKREGKRLVLTPAGHTLLGYADRLLSLAQDAEAALHDENPRGHFRLGAMESTAAVRLPGPLTVYAERYPQVVLELRTGNSQELATAVLNGDVDAALIGEPVAEAKFDSIVAFEDELAIVTSKAHPPLEEAVPQTMIVFEHGCRYRKQLEGWYAERREMPERTIELRSHHAMLGCVAAGMGAALLPKSVISTFPDCKRFRIHTLPEKDRRLRTMLAWQKGVRSARIEALAAILREPAE